MAATSVTSLIFMFIVAFTSNFYRFTAQSWVKAGYWYAGSDFPIPNINSALFTHLICAFADVNSTSFELSIKPEFGQNFSIFAGIVKQKNPSVVTVMSIWNGQATTYQGILGEKANSSVLSLMVKEGSYRKKFIDSSIRTARRFGFQGIDLFWLWPNGNDLLSIGNLLDEFRAAIATEKRNQGVSELILTMGIHYSPYIDDVSYPIESLRKNLDWAHVVAYDYHMPSRENFTGNHAALYNPLSNKTTDFGITQWLRRGLPANKLVLGLPYHGYAWTLVNPSNSSLGAPASGPAVTLDGSIGYRFINSYIQNYGYGAKPVYDSTYVVNYFVVGSTWINYDDVETVRAKVSYAKDKGLIGYNVFQVIHDLSFAAQDKQDDHGKKRLLLLEILLPISIVIVILALVTFYFWSRVRGKNETTAIPVRSLDVGQSASATQGFDRSAPMLQVFTFAAIKAATDNFSSKNLLGEGGFGPVYKGKLHRGLEIAVKRLALSSAQGYEEFKNEVSLTAGLQHVNLVRVVGFCTEKEEKMLVYEYMPNRSLDLYLFDPIKRYFLEWTKRVHIIEGITQGLLYLQEYSNLTIIHRDLKASNILLDAEMNPKISDFGMAKLFGKDMNEANTGRIVGTYGYIPPEYVKKGIYSMKYDVYSFGVLLLLMISGKRNTCFYGAQENMNLLEYAYELWRDGEANEFFDPSLDDSSSDCKLITCMKVALLCVQEDPDDRPTMLEVFSMLKNDAMIISTPKRPAFSVKTERLEETASSSHQQAGSVYDSQISELEPR